MRRALGKGLSQLLAEQFDASPSEVPIDSIEPNLLQPRRHFDDSGLEELAASIREFGVLSPLLVRQASGGAYELIAGERRLRAARLAGLGTIPVLVRTAGNQASLEMALIENIQRQDINALECGRAYRRLIDEFGLTQEQVADRVGKSRTSVANTVRLLRLPDVVQRALEEGRITEGHARALLAFDTEPQQLAVFEQIVEKGLSVREVEKASKTAPKRKPVHEPSRSHRDPNDGAIEEGLSAFLGAPVRLARSDVGGRLTIEFFSDEDLSRILDQLGFQL